jgi:hypothetical protein
MYRRSWSGHGRDSASCISCGPNLGLQVKRKQVRKSEKVRQKRRIRKAWCSKGCTAERFLSCYLAIRLTATSSSSGSLHNTYMETRGIEHHNLLVRWDGQTEPTSRNNTTIIRGLLRDVRQRYLRVAWTLGPHDPRQPCKSGIAGAKETCTGSTRSYALQNASTK